FSSRRRHTRLQGNWSSDVCSSDLDNLYLDLSLHRRGDLRQRPQHVEIQVITRDEPLRHIGLSLNVALGKLQTGRPHEKQIADVRSEERRVGKECRSWMWS